MITVILKSYFAILLSIGLGAIFIFTLGLYFIFRKRETHTSSSLSTANKKLHPVIKTQPLTISSQDISAIAGDDVIATQLDLARAYIESDRKPLAKKILEHVSKFGKIAQQREAQNLLVSLQHEATE